MSTSLRFVPSIAGGSFSLMDRLGAKRKDVLMAAEIKRYSRHLILPEVGMAGEVKIKKSSPPNQRARGVGGPLTPNLQAPRRGRPGVGALAPIDARNPHRPV